MWQVQLTVRTHPADNSAAVTATVDGIQLASSVLGTWTPVDPLSQVHFGCQYFLYSVYGNNDGSGSKV